MIKVLVCGGRTYDDRDYLFKTLDGICLKRGWILHSQGETSWLPDVFIIAGKAKGADTLAVDWAVTNRCYFKEYPADWNKYGRRAGYVRNQQMLDGGKPDVVIAFPGGAGTAMMKDIARKAGVEVIEIAQ